MMRSLSVLLAFALQVLYFPSVQALCDDPSPAFPLPNLNQASDARQIAQENIYKRLKRISSKPEFNTSSFSVEITSSTDSLFSVHHTALVKNEARPGTVEVDGNSLYAIASVTKVFTVLALIQLHAAGKLRLDDPVNQYLAELNQTQTGSLPWKDITLRALASQLSGLPRDMHILDFLYQPDQQVKFGLPPVSRKTLEPRCIREDTTCNADDLLQFLKASEPVFAPNQKASYSNLNYQLLSLVIEKVTGMPYNQYLQQEVLQGTIGVNDTGFDIPSETIAVIPKDESWWGQDLGIFNATGGLYSCTNDMTKSVQYILTHYNGLTPVLNWLAPSAFTTGRLSSYGMPWEILRAPVADTVPASSSSSIKHTRPLTLVTKGGDLPGYAAMMVLIPEYGVGISVLTAGANAIRNQILDVVITEVVQWAETAIVNDLTSRYAGTYVPAVTDTDNNNNKNKNSSMTISYSPLHGGLEITSLTMHGADTKGAFTAYIAGGSTERAYSLYLTPTLLYADEETQTGEKWRMLAIPDPDVTGPKTKTRTTKTSIFDGHCIADVEFRSYAGRSVNELVFDFNRDRVRVRLPAFEVELVRSPPSGRGKNPRSSSPSVTNTGVAQILLNDAVSLSA